MWLNNYNIEVMIWVDNHGQRPAGSVVGHATIFGQRFAVWRSGNDYFAFVLDHNETSGITHMLASIRWLISHGLLKPNVTLTQVNFGCARARSAGRRPPPRSAVGVRRVQGRR